MKSPKISIIIPALNEEVLLPRLLESIEKQSFTDYEVIVADASSEDSTREIAQEYGAKVIEGGMPGIGRNRGAEVAKGEYFCFMDADIVLPEDFLLTAFAELRERNLAGATCRFVPDSTSVTDMLFANYFVSISFFSDGRLAGGGFILVRKDIFEAVGGFDESLHLKEDYDFSQRASKDANFGFLYRPYVSISVRRWKKEGKLNLLYRYLMNEISEVLNIEDVEYEFGHYSEEDLSQEEISKRKLLLERVSDIREKLEQNMDKDAYDKSKAKGLRLKASMRDSYLDFLRLLKVKKL